MIKSVIREQGADEGVVTEDLSQIQRGLAGLRSRQQVFLLAGASLQAGLALCVGLLLLGAGASLGWARPSTAPVWFALLAGLALLPWLAMGRAWGRPAGLRGQAERVEGRLPELRGALLTAVDRAPAPGTAPGAMSAGMTSAPEALPDLYGGIAGRAARVMAGAGAGRIWPAAPLIGWAGALWAGLVATVLGELLLPVGPLEALRSMMQAPMERMEAPQVIATGPAALVGDITLRYLYPTYTGLPPLEVPNSNGEVHAPPGTRVEVRARSAEVYEQAALQLGQMEALPAELLEGRQVSGAFDIPVGDPDKAISAWRILLEGAGGPTRSPDYPLVIEPDLPPDVSVQSDGKRFSVEVDQPIQGIWRARDDYGLARVVVEVRQKAEKGKKGADKRDSVREVVIHRPVGTPREAGDPLRVTPEELGLKAGDRATIRVGAWDNDAISGSKAGWSSAMDVEVIGPGGDAPELEAWREMLRDALVDALAPFLMDDAPPFGRVAEAQAFLDAGRTRYIPVYLLAEERKSGPEQEILQALWERRAAYMGFIDVLSRSKGATVAGADAEELLRLQQEHLAALEDTVLYFDQVIQMAAAARLLELLKQLHMEAEELAKESRTLSTAMLASRMEQLERMMQQVEEQTARMGDQQGREFLEDRMRQVRALMKEAQRAAGAGEREQAVGATDQVAEQIREMVEGFEELQQRGRQKENQLAQAMKGLQEELKRLQEAQQALREQTQAARGQYGPQMEQAVRAWEELEARSQKLSGQVQQTARKNGESAASGAIDAAQQDARGLQDSVRARDLDVALRRAQETENSLRSAESRAALGQRLGEDNAELQRELKQQRAEAQEIRERLEEIQQQQQQAPPGLQQQLQQQSGQQQQLSEQIEQARRQSEEIRQQLPQRAPGLQQGMEQASGQSGRAAEAMEQGQAQEAEGGQQATEDGLQEAQEALQQAQQQMAQQRQQAEGGEGEGEGSSGDGESGQQEIELPAPEDFMTPEEYRRALMEGMEGEVPEEYKALNRRYYEELVR